MNSLRTKKLLVPAFALLLIASPFWPAVSESIWAEEASLATVPVGECNLSLETNSTWRSLRLRAQHPRYELCHIEEANVLTALEAGLGNRENRTLDFDSISFGRLIDYPWLVRHLVQKTAKDRRWNRKKGRPVGININRFVADILFDKTLLKGLQTELGPYRFRIVGISVEKVLVGHKEKIPIQLNENITGHLPFDAQFWLRLKKE